MACPEAQTKDGFEMQLGTNHLAHFLLFQLLKPALLASCTPDFQSRVVSVSSSGHQASGICFDDLNLKKQGYNKWTAYGQSKTANIYMANEVHPSQHAYLSSTLLQECNIWLGQHQYQNAADIAASAVTVRQGHAFADACLQL